MRNRDPKPLKFAQKESAAIFACTPFFCQGIFGLSFRWATVFPEAALRAASHTPYFWLDQVLH